MRLLLSALVVMLPLCALSQDPPPAAPKKGGGGPPKNLKILKPQDLRALMPEYARALGVRCDHCHVPGDNASDDKPQKTTARMMIQMVNEINAKFPDGAAKAHVTCYTCHNGKVTPLTAPPTPAAQ